MSITTLIFRIDFKSANYEIINSPGTIIQILNEMGEDYWTEFQDSAQSRILTAVHQEKDTIYKQLTVEPTAIHFLLDLSKGIEFNALDRNEHFTSMLGVVGLMCEKFKIEKILRSGLRFICLRSLGKDNVDLKPMFNKFIDGKLIDVINSSVGPSKDYCIRVDGEASDTIKYHLEFGPYDSTEAQKYFPRISEGVSQLTKNILIDIDLFEQNFVLKIKPAAWAKTLIAKADKLIAGLEKAVTEKI